MGDAITIGTGSDVVLDDMERDIQMVHIPRLVHKAPIGLHKSDDIVYGGHLMWLAQGASLTLDDTLIATDVQTDITLTGNIINTDLSAFIPKNIGRVNGALLLISTAMKVAPNKSKETTDVAGYVYFSLQYNAVPSGYNMLVADHQYAQSTSVEADQFQHKMRIQATCPVIYYNRIPYITTKCTGVFSDMGSQNAVYYFLVDAMLIGLLQ